MGVYIPDVKLPPDKKYKWDLLLHISYDGTVRNPWGNLITDKKAIELPPHGRLIDADALNIYQMEENVRADGDPNEYEYDAGLIDGLHIAAKDVSVAPTVIPADDGGADNG